MRKIATVLLLMLLIGLSISCKKDDNKEEPTPEVSTTVFNIIKDSENHTTLESALEAAGLSSTLEGDDPFTVFAPTDDAFNALPEGVLNTLLEDPTGELAQILLYHVVPGTTLKNALSDGKVMVTSQGEEIQVAIYGGNVFINNALITQADIEAKNGVVHVVNAVLNIPSNTIPVYEGWTLLWNDEFDGETINTENWTYETGDGTDYGLPPGWGNDEKQIYTGNAENASIIMDGDVSVLAITALEDNAGGYTSAKLTTENLFTVRFGRIDVRAKMPEGQGFWPAIWMLGSNRDLIDWPGCGEIDIAEVLGNEPWKYYSTLHYTNAEHEHGETQQAYELTEGSFSDDYHVFSLEWTPETIIFMMDGIQIQQVPIEEDMKEFLRSSYFILNLAVGGYWPGDPDETTVFPATMYTDYIRVYAKDDLQAPEAPVLDIEEETIGQIIEPNIADNAVRDGFTAFGSMTVTAYGPGAPEILTSETAIDGDLSLVYDFPGGNWGGAYIELVENKDLSNYTHVKFALNKPESMVNAEIKLESASLGVFVFLADYTGTELADGFIEYSIPLADFEGIDLTDMRIPFAMWNAQDANNEFIPATVLIDDVRFSD